LIPPPANASLMEQHIFAFSLIIEGTTEKGVEVYNATFVNLQQKLWFH
jgi:hypothetical protein